MYQNKRKIVLHTFAHGQQESIVANLGIPHHPLPPPPSHMNYIHSTACNSTTKSLLKTKESKGMRSWITYYPQEKIRNKGCK
jgi:hypothetical protein